MTILGINIPCQWVQIITNGRRYTCPIREVNGELFFAFKKQLHKVADYVSELTHTLK